MEKPAAGGGAAGFPIEPNGDWEEECRHSSSRPWEEEWAFCIHRSFVGGGTLLR